jgi:hypothetical protein
MYERAGEWNGERKAMVGLAVALLLALLTAGPLASEVRASCSGDDPYDPAAGGYQAVSFAENPELMMARRYTAAVQSESSLLAANPELNVSRSYVAQSAVELDSGFLAANPELKVARAYASFSNAGSAAQLVLACGLETSVGG